MFEPRRGREQRCRPVELHSWCVASRKCDIAFMSSPTAVWHTMTSPDPLPFDLNAPIVEIGGDDFGILGIWTARRAPEVYGQDCPVPRVQVCQTNRAGKNSFVPGRFAMTRCVQDIQFVGFPQL